MLSFIYHLPKDHPHATPTGYQTFADSMPRVGEVVTLAVNPSEAAEAGVDSACERYTFCVTRIEFAARLYTSDTASSTRPVVYHDRSNVYLETEE